jgi:hypothetical protein
VVHPAAAAARAVFFCSNSGFNSGGNGVTGTGVGDLGRATYGSSSDDCILEGSGNSAITDCGKRKLQQVGGTGEAGLVV